MLRPKGLTNNFIIFLVDNIFPCVGNGATTFSVIVTQHNDTQHNDTWHNDTEHNETDHNDTQHNVTQHIDAKHNALSIMPPRIMTPSIMTLILMCYIDTFSRTLFNCHILCNYPYYHYTGCPYAVCPET